MKKLLLMALLSTSCFAQIDKVGDWHVEQTIDPFNDGIVETAYSGGGRDILAVRCKDGESNVFIITKKYVGDKSQTLAYRVDKGEIKSVYANASTSGTGMFIKNSNELISSMYGAHQIFIKFQSYKGQKHIAKFRIAEAENALYFYAKCGM